MLIQLPAGEESCIHDLLRERIQETNIETRLDFEYVKALLSLNQNTNNCAVFTDDKEKPGCLLIMTVGRTTIFPEQTAFTNVIHVSKEIREANPTKAAALAKSMLTMAQAYSKKSGAEVIRISSWVYRGCKDISQMFLADGFELQSMEYIKRVSTPQTT